MKNKNEIKDKAILFGWITGLLIVISMIWIFTQPLQTRYLQRSVNSVFMNNNDSRRALDHLPVKSGQAGLMGFWYKMQNTEDLIFVFTIFNDGILVPFGAIVSVNGNVEEIIPLSAHAVQVYEKIPQSIIQIYIKQIEKTAVAVVKG